MAMMRVENLLIRPIMTRVLSHTYDKWQDPLTVFLRTACVGNSVIPRIFRPTRLAATYAQKCHVDFLYYLSQESRMGSITDISLPVLGENMKHWHQQNLNLDFKKNFLDSDFSLFDSFCELTDLKLEVAENIWAYGHKKDFNLNPKEKYNFIEITLEDIKKTFVDILEKKMLVTPDKPLIYLFYSSINDPRDKYRLRSKGLLEMGQFLEEKYPCFRLLMLDSSEYEPSESDMEKYHYSIPTTVKLAAKLELILHEFGIKTSRYKTRI